VPICHPHCTFVSAARARSKGERPQKAFFPFLLNDFRRQQFAFSPARSLFEGLCGAAREREERVIYAFATCVQLTA